jgi:hypothetical protein
VGIAGYSKHQRMNLLQAACARVPIRENPAVVVKEEAMLSDLLDDACNVHRVTAWVQPAQACVTALYYH